MSDLTYAQKIDLLTPTYVQSICRYDEEQGKVFWRKRPDYHFITKARAARWNDEFAGAAAAVFMMGQLVVCVPLPPPHYHARFDTLETRVAWFLTFEVWPKGRGDVAEFKKMQAAQ